MLQTLMEYGATVGVAGSKYWLHACCSEDAGRDVQLRLQ